MTITPYLVHPDTLGQRTSFGGNGTYGRSFGQAVRLRTAAGCRPRLDRRINRCEVLPVKTSARGIAAAGFDGVGMTPELRESRAALILIAAVVVSVLIFGAVTLFSQIG